ncbi:MAG: cyclic nucleotide-binding domain-containing protein [Chloroflexota bacterium]|nr:cyclic nucleotide-binding domain-containing protein [Chloroflexota bacterium]
MRQSILRTEHCQQNSIICAENSESTEMYIVDSGRVNLEIEAVPKMHLQVSSLKRNEAFGWEALVPPYRYTTSAKAAADSDLIVLDGEKMRKLCETSPDICARVMEHVVRIAADQLAATRQQMFMLYHSK